MAPKPAEAAAGTSAGPGGRSIGTRTLGSEDHGDSPQVHHGREARRLHLAPPGARPLAPPALHLRRLADLGAPLRRLGARLPRRPVPLRAGAGGLPAAPDV